MKKEKEKKSILKKICIILSIIVGCISLILCILSFFSSFIMPYTDFFGPILKIILFYLGFRVIIYGLFLIAFIWFCYGIIHLFMKCFFNKLSYNKQKILLISATIFFSLLTIAAYFARDYSVIPENIDLFFNAPSMFSDYYRNGEFNIIYNDKMYYMNNINSITYNYEGSLNEMNLNGNNNRVTKKDDSFRLANIYFVYNNELYYYSQIDNENKKINLKTNKISTVGDNADKHEGFFANTNINDNFLRYTLNNGIVYSFVDNAVAGNAYSIFKKVDLNSNKTLDTRRVEDSIGGNNLFLDYDGLNMFYLSDSIFSSDIQSIYKNDEKLYEVTELKRGDQYDHFDILAIKDNYLYFYVYDTIKKLDIDSKTIVKEFDKKISNVKRFNSGSNSINYFYSNNKIYCLNTQEDKLELIVDSVDGSKDIYVNDVRIINNKMYFKLIKYIDYKEFYKVIVIDLNTKKQTIYDKLLKVDFDEKYMYSIKKNNDKYSVTKIDL